MCVFVFVFLFSFYCFDDLFSLPPHAVGTLSALVFALGTYAFICFVLASTVQRTTLKSDMLVIDTVVQETTNLPVVFIGICGTTLSSVLSYMLGAPRTLF